jgi:primosomal protein N' (replication factor Y) (superfamily II helicase)
VTIADVAFDVPLLHPFSYRVPDGWNVARGQRVVAPLGAAQRVGMVLALREGDATRLKPLMRLADARPVLDDGRLALVEWISSQSLSSIGSTCAALLPPPSTREAGGWRRAGAGETEAPPPGVGSPASVSPAPARRHPPGIRTTAETASAEGAAAAVDQRRLPELLIGAGRERRLVERIATSSGATLVIVADVEAAARWAQRLAKVGPVVRLDSGVEDEERAAAWRTLERGEAWLGVGTRSALLAPLAPPATLALVDEQEAAHKPPGPPRLHSREIVLERGDRDGAQALLTAATPAVETWWRATDAHAIRLSAADPAPWPAVSIADTRGILRREPLTPPVSRAMRETLAAGGRVFLGVSRRAAALACDECGAIVRCPACAIALPYSRAAAVLTCRLCGASVPPMDTCPTCHGRRLSPFGWSAERVEHAVRRRFPKSRVARYDPEARRGARGDAQRAAAATAEVVIGTRGALRLFGPASLGLAAFVSPDQLLRVPDFRAGERMFALLWAAAERVGGGGAVILQSQNPQHYAFDALARQDLAAFYRHELKFRAELGYPPFRRLAVVTIEAREEADGVRLADAVAAALGGLPSIAVYPPAADRRGRRRRIVVKGPADLPTQLAEALAEFRVSRSQRRGIMEVEVDPVEWQY